MSEERLERKEVAMDLTGLLIAFLEVIQETASAN
jgi:hypothetical protein